MKPGLWIVVGVVVTFILDWALVIHYRVLP